MERPIPGGIHSVREREGPGRAALREALGAGSAFKGGTVSWTTRLNSSAAPDRPSVKGEGTDIPAFSPERCFCYLVDLSCLSQHLSSTWTHPLHEVLPLSFQKYLGFPENSGSSISWEWNAKGLNSYQLFKREFSPRRNIKKLGLIRFFWAENAMANLTRIFTF